MQKPKLITVKTILVLLALLLLLAGCTQKPIEQLLIKPLWKKNTTRSYTVLKTAVTGQKQRQQAYVLNLSIMEKSKTDYEVSVQYLPDQQVTTSTNAYDEILKTLRIRYKTDNSGRLLQIINLSDIKLAYTKLLNSIIAGGGFDSLSPEMLQQMGLSEEQYINTFLEEIEILHCLYNAEAKIGEWLEAPNPFLFTGTHYRNKAGIRLNSVDLGKQTASITLMLGEDFNPAAAPADTKVLNQFPVTSLTWKVEGTINYKTGWIEYIHAAKATERGAEVAEAEEYYLRWKK